MNNWRFLLLAFLAVFQPIASFNERHLVDGRQQCCDRQTPSLLRDTRPPYGTFRYTKAIPSRLDPHDYREHRQELRRDAAFRESAKEVFLDSQERNIRQGSPVIARPNRDVRHFERDTNELNRYRDFRGYDKEWSSRNNPDSITRSVRKIVARSSDVRQNDRNIVETARTFRIANRVANERSPREMSALGRNMDGIRSELTRDRQLQTRNSVTGFSLNREVDGRRLSSRTNQFSLRLDARTRITDNRNDERRSGERRSRTENILIDDSDRVLRSERISYNTLAQERRQNGQRTIEYFKNRISIERVDSERINVRDRQIDNAETERFKINRVREDPSRTLAQDRRETSQENRRNFINRLSNERLNAGRFVDRRHSGRDVTEERLSSRNIRDFRNNVRNNDNERFADRHRDASRYSESDGENRRDYIEFRGIDERRITNNRMVNRDITQNQRNRVFSAENDETRRYNERAARNNLRFTNTINDERVSRNSQIEEISRQRTQDFRKFVDRHISRQVIRSNERLARTNSIDYSSRNERDSSRSFGSLENVLDERRIRLAHRVNSREKGEIRNIRQSRAERVQTNSRVRQDDDRNTISRSNRIETRRDTSDNARNTDGLRERRTTEENRRMESRNRIREDLSRTANRASSFERRVRSDDRNSREVRGRSQSLHQDNARDISRNRINSDRTRERQTENRLLSLETSDQRMVYTDDLQKDSSSPIGFWRLAFYTLQAAYLINLLLHMMAPKRFETSKMNTHWWSYTPALIKVD